MTVSSFRLALDRYADARRVAYDAVTAQVIRDGIAPASLRLTDIDARALSAWEEDWRGRSRFHAGGWDWRRICLPLHRRPSAFHCAIWSADRLCGLAAGRVSARRAGGVRHTLSVYFLESVPDRDQPLRGQVALLALTAAEAYGRALGASRLRLIDPLPGVLMLYVDLGFRVVWRRSRPVYCEREITR